MFKHNFNWFLYFATIVANMFSFTCGIIIAWNSPIIPKLLSNNTDINPLGRPLGTIEVSISSSIVPVASIIGTLSVGKCGEVFGRKKTLIYLGVFNVLSFIGISFARHFYTYILFLASGVVCTAAGFLLVPVYVAEIAENSNRGQLGCLASVSISLGHLYVYILGPLTSVSWFALICAIPSIIFLLLSIYLPESPVFLFTKRSQTEAVVALKKLRKGKTINELQDEFQESERMIKSSFKEETAVLFKTKSGRKSMLISIVVRLTQQACGGFILLSFLNTILKEAGSNLSENVGSIVVGAANIPVSIFALYLIERKGRRYLLLIAGFFCGLCMLLLGIYFAFIEFNYVIPSVVKYLPVICIILFLCMFTFGFSNVPCIIVSELLPNEARSLGSSLVMVTGNMIASLIAFVYPIIADTCGAYVGFLIFSVFSFSGFTYIYIYLPETKGKSFFEIKQKLESL